MITRKTTSRPASVSAISMLARFMICLAAPFCLIVGFVSLADGAERPNFVWLISEDNSTHYLKLFDENGAETPEIARLAEHGLIFDHAFSNGPVCSVARSTLITGCYAPRIGTQYHRRSVLVPMPEGVRMFPAYLREAGYYTANNRKKDYNAIEGKGVWDESSGKASWRKRKPGQPFFYKQSFPVCHESSLHFSAETMRTEKTATDPATVFVSPYHPKTPTFRYTYARYHDRIGQMDEQIGAVVDRLEADALLEDTFIFYFGDHGGVLPRGKGYAYESGLHVPLVVHVPENWKHLIDAKVGSRVGGFVSFIDFGPTLLNLAAIDVPDGVDGRPFLGKGVSMDEVNRRDEAFGYADRFDEKYDLVRTLRKGKFEYVRNYQPFNFDGLQNDYRYKMLAYTEWRELYQAGKLNAVESQFFESRAPEALYDIEADPHETRNLADDPAYTSVLTDLRRRLTDRVKGLPDLSLYPESYLVDEGFEDPVSFGRAHKEEIGRLVDLADLSLVPFAEARPGLEFALASGNPWDRYWGLIVCSAHGKSAIPLLDKAKSLAADDPELLVRARAAEFLGLIGAVNPVAVLEDVLLESESIVEANLILNTAVLLRDGKPGYEFSLPRGKIVGDRPGAKKDRYVNARLDYVNR